jgi:hypothetical protein
MGEQRLSDELRHVQPDIFSGQRKANRKSIRKRWKRIKDQPEERWPKQTKDKWELKERQPGQQKQRQKRKRRQVTMKTAKRRWCRFWSSHVRVAIYHKDETHKNKWTSTGNKNIQNLRTSYEDGEEKFEWEQHLFHQWWQLMGSDWMIYSEYSDVGIEKHKNLDNKFQIQFWWNCQRFGDERRTRSKGSQKWNGVQWCQKSRVTRRNGN